MLSSMGHNILKIHVKDKDTILATYVVVFLKTQMKFPNSIRFQAALKWKPYEPTAKERRQAEQIKKSQEERQKKR